MRGMTSSFMCGSTHRHKNETPVSRFPPLVNIMGLHSSRGLGMLRNKNLNKAGRKTDHSPVKTKRQLVKITWGVAGDVEDLFESSCVATNQRKSSRSEEFWRGPGSPDLIDFRV